MPAPLARLLRHLPVLAALLLIRPASAAEPPMRLDAAAQPLAYALRLKLDPRQPAHEGEVVIDVTLRRPVRTLTLHAQGLTIASARWQGAGAARHAAVAPLGDQRVTLTWPRKLAAGRGRLQLRFAGRLDDKASYGLFRQSEGGQWYAFTQFEPTAARRAFPLFDEPGFKVPFTLTLEVPREHLAFANEPEVASTEAGAAPGYKRVRFATTKPIPSYLLAFGVGPFSVLEAGRVGQRQVPLRFIAPQGRATDAAFAAEVTPRIVAALEAYFGQPYPYAKLDSMSLPMTATFGAMEHPGLITYASRLLLAPAGERTPQFERDYVSIAAHELAHQWFGNLVTMAWWDDLWLNESFASWMGDRITDQVMPQWQWHTSTQRARTWAMRNDRLLSARRIQQPVTRDDDIGNLFDGIAYAKGQTVLSMFEAWLGEARFREGVRRYMARHAWGNATGAQFFDALADGDAAVSGALRSFVTQAGIPRLRARLECLAGERPALVLSQARLLPLGSQPSEAERAQTWQVPLRIATPAGLTPGLLATREGRIALPDAGCPAWVQANAGGAGYFRVAYEPGTPQPLRAQPAPTTGEAMAGLDDAMALTESGDIDASAWLEAATAMAARPERRVVQTVIEQLLAWRALTPADDAAAQAAQAALWQRLLGERARALGWLPRPGDSEDAALLRTQLLPALVRSGADAELRVQATTLARAWLADRTALPAGMRRAVLASAALAGDAPLFEAYGAALRASTQRNEREDLYAALGAFVEPALAERARALLLDPTLEPREAIWPLLEGEAGHPVTRTALLDFLARHYDALAARVSPETLPYLPMAFTHGCSAAEAQRIEAVFAPRAGQQAGGRRLLAQALETVRLCDAWGARQGASWRQALGASAR